MIIGMVYVSCERFSLICTVMPFKYFFLGTVSGEAALYRNYYYYFLSYIMCHQSIVDKFLVVSWTNSLFVDTLTCLSTKCYNLTVR